MLSGQVYANVEFDLTYEGSKSMNKQGLREFKKEATAHALAEAAFQLTLERGIDGFVVDDVVQTAGYSRRTFANYYSCKEEAIAMSAVPYHGTEEFIDLVNRLPENTSPLELVHHLTKMQLAGDVIHKMRRLVELSKKHPTLEPYTLSVIYGLQTKAQNLLDDLFREQYATGFIHFLVGAAYAAIHPLLDGSAHVRLPGQPVDEMPDAISFDEYIDTAFGYLRNGFQI